MYIAIVETAMRRKSPSISKYTDNDIDKDMKLTHNDYIKIIHYYQSDNVSRKNTNNKSLKERAHLILAQKLCRCIKPPDRRRSSRTSAEKSRRIAYCTRSIFHLKRLRPHGFRCKTNSGKIRPKMIRDITKTAKRIKIT